MCWVSLVYPQLTANELVVQLREFLFFYRLYFTNYARSYFDVEEMCKARCFPAIVHAKGTRLAASVNICLHPA